MGRCDHGGFFGNYCILWPVINLYIVNQMIGLGFPCPHWTHMMDSLYITCVITPKAHVLLLNIGCIGHHVTLSLSDVTTRSE